MDMISCSLGKEAIRQPYTAHGMFTLQEEVNSSHVGFETWMLFPGTTNTEISIGRLRRYLFCLQ